MHEEWDSPLVFVDSSLLVAELNDEWDRHWEHGETACEQVVLHAAKGGCWAHGPHETEEGLAMCVSQHHACNRPPNPSSGLGLCTEHSKEVVG